MTNAPGQEAEGAVMSMPGGQAQSTGEISTGKSFDQAGARRLTMRIQLHLDTIASNVEQVIALVQVAKNSNIADVLGYSSWTSYVAEEFGQQLSRLGVADRRSAEEMLSETGMSTRAIGAIVGVSHATVARDLADQVSRRVTPDAEEPPSPKDIFGDEARAMMAMNDAPEDEAVEDEDLSGETVGRRSVTGLDGKSYSVPPAPPKRRRPPLTDAYWNAIYDLRKAVEKVVRLHADDRFIGLREQLHIQHQADVERLAEALLRIEDELRGEVR